MKKIIIAIDGYSGCGKSSTARAVAKMLGYTYIDSGAMYRAATLHFLNRSTDMDDAGEVRESLESLEISFRIENGEQSVFLNGLNVEDEIRSRKVTEKVSEVSKLNEVRKELVAQQRASGKKKGVVMDGRDIGTVVFPDAELKIFMTADLDIRAERRQKELHAKGDLLDYESIKMNLSDRDLMDTTRKESPLTKAADAVEIDTGYLEFEEQVNRVIDLAKQKMG